MDLADLKDRLSQLAGLLKEAPFATLGDFSRDRFPIRVTLTVRFAQKCRDGRIWKSKGMLKALRNAEYGFDPQKPRSRGGEDGIFLLDRAYRSQGEKRENPMIQKLFGRYLDRADSGAAEVAAYLGAPLDDLLPVRLVCHDLRLLGLLLRAEDTDHLVLVDWDATK